MKGQRTAGLVATAVLAATVIATSAVAGSPKVSQTDRAIGERYQAMAQSWALATGVASPSSQAQNVVAQRYQAMARYYAQTGQTSVLTGAVSDPGRYDGYKSSYPQLHQVPSGAVSDPGSTVDRAIAAYDRQADLEQTRREPAAFDWLDAGIGALVAFGAFSLLGLGALGLHTRAHRAARPAVL